MWLVNLTIPTLDFVINRVQTSDRGRALTNGNRIGRERERVVHVCSF